MKVSVVSWQARSEPTRVKPSVLGRTKVVFLVSHSSPGGVQEIWANLAEGFQGRGFDVALVALYPDRKPARETPADVPWRYILHSRPRSPLGVLRLFAALVKFFLCVRPAIVFSAMPAANVLAAAAAVFSRSWSSIVISHHTPVHTYSPVLNAADGMVGSLCTVRRVLSVSDVVASSLSTRPRPYVSKRRTVHNALPPKIKAHLAALREARARPGGIDRSRRVVATGRLAPQKNYPVLIRAAALMPNVDIQIVGTGPDEVALRALVSELGVGDRVSFLGQRSREDTLEILAKGDVFTQPSLFEGHSLALLEAAALGLPLVVSDVPVQIEGITDGDGSRCGVAVGVNDHVGLAREILRILDDPAERHDASARSLHLAEGYCFERMMDAYLEEVPIRTRVLA